MNFYIATGFARQKDHNKVRDALHAQRYHNRQHLFITYDWTLPEHQIKGKESLIAQQEISGVIDADFVVVLLPGKYGTHAELGAALARGIKVFLSGPKDTACIFYDHPLVSYLKETDLISTICWWGQREYDRAIANEP